MKKSKDPYKNRIREVMRWKASDKTTPYTIQDGFHAACNWDLRPEYLCIVRSKWITGQVEERSYKSFAYAQKYIDKCMENLCELSIITHDEIRDTIPTEDY